MPKTARCSTCGSPPAYEVLSARDGLEWCANQAHDAERLRPQKDRIDDMRALTDQDLGEATTDAEAHAATRPERKRRSDAGVSRAERRAMRAVHAEVKAAERVGRVAPEPEPVPATERAACLCGCGATPSGKKARFMPGHDARYHGRIKRGEPGTQVPAAG